MRIVIQRKTGWHSIALGIVTLVCVFTVLRIHQTQVRLRDAGQQSGFYGASNKSGPQAPPEADRNGVGELHTNAPSNATQVDLVVASTQAENTSWLQPKLLHADSDSHWRAQIYIVDSPSSDPQTLTVPVNKGREAMTYLTYIVDRYDSLPSFVVFTHASRFQWHNDDPDYDGLAILRNLQLPYVTTQDYVNLRCVWVLGCPVEIRPIHDAANPDHDHPTSIAYKSAFEQLLPGVPVPEEVGQACCAQFAVSREAILSRPREEYEHFRKWLINTPLDDDTAGRVFEYLWHIIFGKEPVFCPDAGECYCKVFGLCGLKEQGKCDRERCEGRYTLPKYSQLPTDWPYVDWDGSDREYTDLKW